MAASVMTISRWIPGTWKTITWLSSRPVRRPFSRSSTARTRVEVLILPFISKLARPSRISPMAFLAARA
ncbi:MAG: hypothetical protein F4Z21_06190 [Acidobacteria bacterium]|nr:hypothetical protein [Acidobacteriota bacterium]